jgi:hypothetical protein
MGKKYSEYELNFLKENYPNNGAKFCSDLLKRPINTIYNKVNQLKLKATYNHTKLYKTDKDKKLSIKNNYEKWYKENELKEKERLKKYRENNIEKTKKYKKEWDKNNPEKLKNNIEKYKPNRRKNYKKRINNEPLFKLKTNISGLIKQSLKRKGYSKQSKSATILDCSYEEFKLYLESKFKPWMNWDNCGNPKDGILELNKTWDIDHIIPLSSAKTEEDVIKLNHYTNLQPLCSYTNRIIKKGKINYF